MKKLISILGAAALLMAFVVPTFAYWHMPSINADVAFVKNESSAISNTGSNMQVNYIDIVNKDPKKPSFGFFGRQEKTEIELEGDNFIHTGDATAETNTKVYANVNKGCFTCGRDGRNSSIDLNLAMVSNSSMAMANTGENMQQNSIDLKGDVSGEIELEGDNTICTGDADATTNTWTVVNAQKSGWNR